MSTKRTRIKDLFHAPEDGKTYTVMGWVRTHRRGKDVSFIAVNDGSTISPLQVVAAADGFDCMDAINTGAALKVTGKLAVSQGSGQDWELHAEEMDILGKADPEKYPIQPKRHTLEFLREHAHLRVRTNTFSAVFRIRHNLAYAIHKYFHDKGFIYWHSPIITTSDAEGAGEMFRVSALDALNPPKDASGSIDWSKDFFGAEASLTVSGQLEAELAALGLGDVYTFGPTFRAENSNTSRHLAEFWMIEPEMAFYDIHDNMDLAEDCLKYLLRFTLENCADDLAFLAKRRLEEEKQLPGKDRAPHLVEQLEEICSQTFERITYTTAFDVLRNSKPNKKRRFKFPVSDWGIDFQSEHERFLVEKHYKKPVIITDYPREIKAFYMKVNEDEKTVRGMDVLFPGIGEIIGGSQREENYDVLLEGMKKFSIPPEHMSWYLDTRRFGSVPHSGFGLGFERLVLFVTGMKNIRDVIPFPRTPGNASF